jgi:hypothetical protein
LISGESGTGKELVARALNHEPEILPAWPLFLDFFHKVEKKAIDNFSLLTLFP